MLKARITEEPDGRACLETPYHAELVSWLRTLPSGSRSWDPDRKRWLISMLYAEEVLAALRQYGFNHIQDDRTRTDLAPMGDAAALWAPVGMPADLSAAFYQLGLNGQAPLELANLAFKFWATYLHPDKGGDAAQFDKVNTAIRTIRRYLEDTQEEA